MNREVDQCIEYVDTMPPSSYSFKELLGCDIFVAIIAIGLVGCFMTVVNVSLEYSIQGLQLSYNQNLFLTGLA